MSLNHSRKDASTDLTPTVTEEENRPVFPAEVFALILAHLRNPIPPAKSCPPRCELQQPHLVPASTVCRDFHQICSPLLYTHVVAGDAQQFLLLLALDAKNDSKISRFRYLRSLRLEYKEKGGEVTYRRLFTCSDLRPGDREGLWSRYGSSEKALRRWVVLDCQVEQMMLQMALEDIIAGGLARVCPNLETIAMSSILGNPEHEWMASMTDSLRTGGEEECRPHDVAILFCAALATASSALVRVCVTDPFGPLSFAGIPYPKIGPSPNTTHFALGQPSVLYIAVGSPTTWMSYGKADGLWDEGVRLSIGGTLAGLSKTRSERLPSQPIDLTICCSTNQMRQSSFDAQTFLPSSAPFPHGSTQQPKVLSTFLQRAMASKLEEETRRIFLDAQPAEYKHVKDNIRWLCSADTPVCEACGAGVPA